MNLLADVFEFFVSAENWTGSDGLLVRIGDHLGLSLLATLVAVMLALPPAVWMGHRRRGARFAVAIVWNRGPGLSAESSFGSWSWALADVRRPGGPRYASGIHQHIYRCSGSRSGDC